MPKNRLSFLNVAALSLGGLIAFDFLRKSVGVTGAANQLGVIDNSVNAEPIDAFNFKIRDKIMSVAEFATLVTNNRVPVTTVDLVFFTDQTDKESFAESLANKLRVLKFVVNTRRLKRIDGNIEATLANVEDVKRALAFDNELHFFILKGFIFVAGIDSNNNNELIMLGSKNDVLTILNRVVPLDKVLITTTPTSSNDMFAEIVRDLEGSNQTFILSQDKVQDNLIPFDFNLLR